MPDPVCRCAALRPDAPAIVHPGGTVSWRDLDRLVHGTARNLAATGARRVALCMPDDWRSVAVILACLRAGIVACPISSRLPSEALGTRVREVGAGLLVCTQSHGAAVACDDLIAGGEPAAATWWADAPATAVFTTGSSGEPKAAVHTVGSHVYSALGANENIPLAEGDRWWLSLPLCHVGGLGIVFRCILAGAAVVIAPRGAAAVPPDATHMSLVPTQLRRMACGPAPKSLKAVLVGGGECPPALIDSALSHHWPVHTTYGMTETASQVATTPPGAPAEWLRSSGRILRWCELRIAETGEILVKGPVLFSGYLQGGRTARMTGEDGWFRTGDLGRLSGDGFLHVLGRLDNMFISGGENIQPEEVERALRALPSVADSVVVPIPDDEFGRRPVAFVRTDDDSFDPESVRSRLRTVLPSFEIPDAVLPWPDDPALCGGKIDRSAFARTAQRLCA